MIESDATTVQRRDRVMQKIYGGPRLRRLREERGLTQLELARTLDLSASYVNQLENDQRPLTVPVLLKLKTGFRSGRFDAGRIVASRLSSSSGSAFGVA